MSQEVALEISGSPPQPEPEPEPELESDPTPPTKLEKCTTYAADALFYTFIALFCLVFIPFYLLYAAAVWLICNKDVTDDAAAAASSLHNAPKGIFQKAQEVQETAKKVAKLPTVIRSRLLIIFVAWLIVNLTVPVLKNKLVLDTKLWKWSLLVAMVTCGYHVISMATGPLLDLLCENPHMRKKKNAVYFAKGMRRSVNGLVLSASLLLTWVLYFRTSRGIKKTEDTDVVLHVGTWSFVTLAVAAVLWVLKSVLLLKWEADAVYRRFRARIFSAGLQLYFVGRVCGWRFDIFKPETGDEDVTNVQDITEDDAQAEEQPSAEGAAVLGPGEERSSAMERSSSRRTADDHVIQKKDDKQIRDSERKKAKGILCIDKDGDATLYDIKMMTKYFVSLSRVSSRDQDDGTSDVLKQCRKINPDNNTEMYLTKEKLINTFDLEEHDAKFWYSKLKDEDSSAQIAYKNFEKYMVKAHNNCVALGHTLLDAREVVKVLNQVMTGLLIAIVFIAWLLLTDIATTKILVLIASPLLAVTFVFGDTCKKIFEGIIFSFINHPFDVGDRCIIDNTELEVKRMSVLSTKFVVIGTREEALYPNSTLSSMLIINLKGEPDPSDCVELTLDSKYSKSMLEVLHNKITKHFEEDEGNKYDKAHTIVIKEIGDSVKMEIQYEHVMSIHETTHSQCLRKKRKQKSELLLQLKQFIEEIDESNESSASESN